MATHGACGKSWTGTRMEHCPACHETFTGQSTGDAHRVGDHNEGTGPNRRRCLTPDEMREAGLVLDSRGIWGTTEYTPPVLTPNALAARRRAAQPSVAGSRNAETGSEGTA